MKLINSLNNFREKIFGKSTIGIINNNMKRFWVLSLVYFIITFICVPFVFLLNSGDGFIHGIDGYNPFYDVLMLNSWGLFIVFYTCLFAFVLALVLNNYMHAKDEMIFTHSLPMTRFDNYKSSFLSFSKLLLIPLLINALLVIIEKIGFGFVAFRFVHLLYFVVALYLCALIVYSLTTLCCALCGTAVFSGLLALFLGLLPTILYSVYALTCSQFVRGYFILEETWDLVFDITPIVRLGMVGFEPYTWLSGILYFVFSVVCLVLGYFAYKYKKNEKTTDTLVYEISKPILKYLITMLSIIPGFYALAALSSWNIYASLFGGVLGIFIAYFAMEMIIQKNFFIWRNYKGFIYAVLAFFAITLIIKFDVFGYTRYIPKEEKIESFYVGTDLYEYKDSRVLTANGLEYKDSVYEMTDKFCSDEEAIRLAIELHKKLSECSYSEFADIARMESPYFDWRVEDSEHIYKNTKIAYKLKNGRVVVRSFNYDLFEAMDEYIALANNKEYKKSQVQDLYEIINNDNLEPIQMYVQNNILNMDVSVSDPNKANKILETLYNDYINEDINIYNLYEYYKSSVGSISIHTQYYDLDEYDTYMKLYNKRKYSEEMVQDMLSRNIRVPNIIYTYEDSIDLLKNDSELKYTLFDNHNVKNVCLYKVPVEDFDSFNKNFTAEDKFVMDYGYEIYPEEVVPATKDVYYTEEDNFVTVEDETSLNNFNDTAIPQFKGLELSKDDLNKLLFVDKFVDSDSKYYYYLSYEYTNDYRNFSSIYNRFYPEEFCWFSIDGCSIPKEFQDKLDELNDFNSDDISEE